MRKDWQIKKLADICDVKHGYAFDGKEFSSDVPEENPIIITPGNFTEDGKLLFVEKNTKRFIGIPPAAFCFDVGDLVVVMTDLSSKMKILGKPAFVETNNVLHNQRIGRVRFFSDEINKRYVYYFMLSDQYLQNIKTSATGTMVKHTAPKRILDNEILLPSLPEQQRIVAILDEAFAGIATAKANTEKNLQNACAIFESHLNDVFSKNCKDWVKKPLENVASILNGYAFKSQDFSTKSGVKCIKITNVGVREFISNFDDYLPDSFAELYEKVSVKKDSIVLALTRTIIAGGLKIAVVPEHYNGALLNQRVASIVANAKDLSNAFLFAYLSTQMVVDYVKSRVNTLLQPNLSITDLRAMPIPVPPRCEQNQITDQLGSLYVEIQNLVSLCEQKIVMLDELKKSLLHRAFSGEL